MNNAKTQYKYIYGPVYSWRLGRSLGIDPISMKDKVCNFSCVYCQLGKTRELVYERQEFIPAKEIIAEIESLPPHVEIDYLTFSGRGEPTLAKNLGSLIKAVREIRKEKVAVITNSSLMHLVDVQMDLSLADFVVAKLDVSSQETLTVIDKAAQVIQFKDIVDGLLSFKRNFQGHLALQIMFINENKKYAQDIAQIARKINPDEIQLNTPLRPSAVRPLSKSELLAIKDLFFKGMPVMTVYDEKKKLIEPFNKRDTVLRHGRF